MKNNNKGFSLVELIVVIAIMAILAAVAVVGFSVFIPKAQAQADETLLDTLSDSFLAACLSAGVDARDVEASIAIVGGALKTDASGAVELKINGSASDSQIEEIISLFNDTVKGNKKVRFNMPEKTYKYIVAENGRFAFADDVTINIQVGDSIYEISVGSRDDFLNSTFNNMELGDLTGMVDAVISDSFNSNFVSSIIDPTTGDEGFKAFFLAQPGCTEQDWADTSDTAKQKKLNALVLYTAQGYGDSFDGADALDKIASGNATGSTQLIAMNYAMKIAYITEQQAKLQGIQDPSDAQALILNFNPDTHGYDDVNNIIVNNPGFYDWVNTAEGKASADGYLGAMDMIGTNVGNISETDKNSILTNGYQNDDVLNIIDQILQGQG